MRFSSAYFDRMNLSILRDWDLGLNLLLLNLLNITVISILIFYFFAFLAYGALPVCCFPDNYGFQKFKCNINFHLPPF